VLVVVWHTPRGEKELQAEKVLRDDGSYRKTFPFHVTLSNAKGLYDHLRDSHLHLRAVQVSLRSE
jgi:hypothetical protein